MRSSLYQPLCDGLEATRQIREMGNRVPIIAVTANLMPGDDELCKNSGMDAVITKPVRKADLQEALEALFSVSR